MSQLEIQIPYVRHSQTSKAAAERIKGHAAKQRSIVLGFIMEHGPVSDQEIAEGLEMAGDSVRPRRGELFKSGLIVKHDEDAITKSGRHAARWRVK